MGGRIGGGCGGQQVAGVTAAVEFAKLSVRLLHSRIALLLCSRRALLLRSSSALLLPSGLRS